eukprot:3560307-Ditylum_brightwellii.AAC.1
MAAAEGAEDITEKARLRNKLTEDVQGPMTFSPESEKARCARDKRHTKRKNGLKRAVKAEQQKSHTHA